MSLGAFDPSKLTPAGQPTFIPPEMLGMRQDQYQDIPVNQRPMQQWMQTPDGKPMVQRTGLDGKTIYETPRVGESAVRFEQGKDGSWTPSMLDQGGWSQLGKNAYKDPRFMGFLAIAAGGALAASYAGAGTAAASGTGATGGLSSVGAAPGASGLAQSGSIMAGGTGGGLGSGTAMLGAAPGSIAGTGAGALGTGTFGLTGAGAGAAGLGSLTAPAATTAANGSLIGNSIMNGANGITGAQVATGGGLLSQALDFAKNNPNLVGAGLGALAGAASGNVDMTTTATHGLADYALPAGQAYAGMAQDTINGKYLGQGLGTNPYAGKNPFLDKAMSDVAGRMTDAYKNGTAAQSMGQFQQGGAFGGSAHQQFMEGQNRAFADSLGSTMNNMSMQDYTTQQGLAENSLNRQLSQFQGERQNMMGAANGLSNLGGTATQTQQGVGPWQGALAGAAGGWGAGSMWGASQQQTKAQPSAPQQVGGLGGQPVTTGVQMPQSALGYNPTQPKFGGLGGGYPSYPSYGGYRP